MYRLYLFENFEEITTNDLKRWCAILPRMRWLKAASYRQEEHQKQSVVSTLLLLYALRECFGITHPVIGLQESGKPYLVEHPDIHFNISHCICGCICAVSDRKIGVDIQEIRPFSWEIANRVCSDGELEALKMSAYRDALFTKMWAMKESYVKMTGQGICGDLTGIDTNVLQKQIAVAERKECFIAVCEE